jgi:thymidylate synthase (FAD)
MQIVDASYEILYLPENAMEQIELAGRVCYKSEDKITEGSAAKFVAMLLKCGHESVIEHVDMRVRFVCDRGVTHELVRHRLASYSQESTRYCNYSKDKFGQEITVIDPRPYLGNYAFSTWRHGMFQAEAAYFAMLDNGATPQMARSVLPNSLKTEIVMTANLREWRHVLKLRTSEAAHPQMRALMLPLLVELNERLPVLFGDINKDEREEWAMTVW